MQVRYAGLLDEPAAVLTPTFAPPEVTRMRTYELMATPLVYAGETVRARVVADPAMRLLFGSARARWFMARTTASCPSMGSRLRFLLARRRS